MPKHWFWLTVGAATVWAWGIFNIIPPHIAGMGVAIGTSVGVMAPGLAFTLLAAGVGRIFKATHLGIYLAGPVALIGTVIFGMAYGQFIGAA